MANAEITFLCVKCGAQLSVAAELAAVVGRCPACHALIQASGKSGMEAVELSDLPHMPPPEKCPFPKIIRSPGQAEFGFEKLIGQSDSPLASGEAQSSQFEPAEDSGDTHMAMPAGQLAPVLPQASIPDESDEGHWATRPWVWGAVLVVLAMGALLYDVVTIHDPVRGESRSEQPSPSPVDESDEAVPVLVRRKSLPARPKPVIVKSPKIEADKQAVALVERKASSREVLERELRGLSPQQLLKKFLAAKSIDERAPMMSTRSTAAELAGSCLAADLPEPLSVQLEYRDANPGKAIVDSYFGVVFDDPQASAAPHTVLVRQQGEGIPQVIADPFLDLYGGRLNRFIERPVKGEASFQVVVTAQASCKDPRIPNHRSKMTLLLLPRDQGDVIAKAYFSKGSSIARLLEDGTFRLSYGNPTVCEVLLRWNTAENRQAPYLEAVAIKAFAWGRE